METAGIRLQGLGLRWVLLAFVLHAVIVGAAWAEIIPSSRRVAWQGNVGVLGDIPSRTKVGVNVKNAPYNAVGDGVADDTSALVRAISDCPAGQVVHLPAGVYKVSTPIKVKSGITIRGAGIGATIVKGASSFSGSYIMGFESSSYSWNLSSPSPVDLSSGYTKGSTSLTTARAHGLSAGDIIQVDHLEDVAGTPTINMTGSSGTCNWCDGQKPENRPIAQWNRVLSTPDSKSLTLEIPLYWNFGSDGKPQLVRVDGVISDAGIENLTVDNGLSGNSNTNKPLSMMFVSNCWLYKVEGIGSYSYILNIYGGYRNTIRDCVFHEGIPTSAKSGASFGPNRGYGIYMNPWSSANLIENNQFYHMAMAINFEGATSGNVFAYNYLGPFYHNSNDMAGGSVAFHGAHPMMNLIEGNYSIGKYRADWIWGSCSHNTFFRNRIVHESGYTNGNFLIDLESYHQYFNVVGNVLGTDGFETLHEQTGSRALAAKAVYSLGYLGLGDLTGAGNDSHVKATILRHGNWDSVTKDVVWDAAIEDKELPDSLYLTAKPSWWGSLPWPSFGPDLSPMTGTIPAKLRFEGSLPSPSGVRVVKP